MNNDARSEFKTCSPVDNDKSFNREDALEKHDVEVLDNLRKRDKEYNEILSSYSTYAQGVLKENPGRQKCFFGVSIFILIASFFLLVMTIIWVMSSSDVNFTEVAAAITAGIETLASYLVFPKIIAEYLFNTGENANIRDIVNSIRKYDLELSKDMRAPMTDTDEKTS